MIDANDKSLWSCGFCRFYDPLFESPVCFYDPVHTTYVERDYVCAAFEWFAYHLWGEQKNNEEQENEGEKLQKP